MRLLHTVTLSVFVKPEENSESIEKAFTSLLPLDLAEEKLKLNKTTAQGFEGKNIVILTLFLQKHRHIRAFIEHLNTKLDDETKAKLRTQENRLDEEQNFFLRLDKEALLDGKYVITDGGTCIHCRLNIAAFPKTREAAWQVVQQLFP
ncbi:MAG: RNA-binding domain-containing protein [Candidatus Woesearchaeota archaeon]